jgi:ribulose-phosphate 3-epimerase
MKMEVIPVINCHHKDTECVRGRIKQAEKFAKWVHLDVADGAFTYNRTWAEPEEWKKISANLNLEAHLMVEHPEEEAKRWLAAGAKRIIVHVEALDESKLKNIVREAREASAGVMLALNPETKFLELPEYFRNFPEYQVLAVHPGLAGQKFLPLVLKKIEELRRHVRSARIEVDGGVTPENAKLIKKEGADALASASFIWSSHEPHHNFKILSEI